MSGSEVVLAVVAMLICLAWYLSYNAARLDRLHARVEGSYAVLDAALVRRAEATLELANSAALDPATSLLLADAAASTLTDAETSPQEREGTESDLSTVLRVTLDAEALEHVRRDDPDGADALDRLSAASDRVQLARRFHNDAVTTVRRMRRKGVVRLFRLAGHAPMPRTVEFDDEPPAALRRQTAS